MANMWKKGGLMSVVVVDKEKRTSDCLRSILESNGDFKFAGSFSNAADALSQLPHLQPDLAMVDIGLPDLNGIVCVQQLKRTIPLLKIVMSAAAHKSNWVGASLEAGAIAYLVKPIAAEQLLATLTFAAINENKKPEFKFFEKSAESNLPLNLREKEVLKKMAEGLLYKEISDELGLSFTAVHKCQHKIFKKLHVGNRSEAIRFWMTSNGD